MNSDEMNHVFTWACAHFFVFASAAAIGSGFAALVDASGDHAHGDVGAARWAISLGVAVYILTVWLVRDRHILHQKSASSLLIFAVVIALTPLLSSYQLPLLILLLIAAVTLRLHSPQYKYD